MKTIILKRTMMEENHLDPSNTKTVPFVWCEEIKRLLITPSNPEKGCTYEEMETVIPIHTKFAEFEMPDVGDGQLELEDAEHKVVVDRLKAAHFRVNAPEVYEMIHTVSHPKKKIMGASETD